MNFWEMLLRHCRCNHLLSFVGQGAIEAAARHAQGAADVADAHSRVALQSQRLPALVDIPQGLASPLASPRARRQANARPFAKQSCSNSAKVPNSCTMSSPLGVAVSMLFWPLLKPTPRSCRAYTVSMRWLRLRPKRSSSETTMVAPGRASARHCSSRHCSRLSRFAFDVLRVLR
jgi:hypothetical protein